MQHAIHILDTKTRQTDSVPAEPDTYGSQLQLMLYHHLLTSLISSSIPFDFNALWSYLGLDNERRFEDGFLVQAGLWDGVEDDDISEDGCPRNLADVGRKWRKLVDGCSVVGVDDSMELVYRLQPKDHLGKWKGKGKASEPADLANALRNLIPAQNEEASGEARELAIAIRNSLIDISFPSYRPEYAAYAPCMDVDVDVELQNALYSSLSAVSATEDEEVAPLPPRRTKPHPMFEPGPPLPELPSTPPNQPVELEPQGPPPDVVEEPQVEYDNHGYKIVGRKQVQYDGPKLDAHLDSVFQFWRSERKPVGVPVELARRCK
jgi:exonuclease V